MKVPLAITTSDRADPPLAERARQTAEEVGVPFIARHHKLPLFRILQASAQALVVFESEGISLVDPQGTLRFSPGIAHLRIRQIDRGVLEDQLVRVAAISPGDAVLDCTLGLGADAQVAARLVGASGKVTALESSTALFLLMRHGLARLPRIPAACRIDVLHQSALTYLRALPTGTFDVVLFDPMFERPRKSSAAFEVLRRHADPAPLTLDMLAEAQRVARRAVVLKGSRYSQDFRKLGVTALPARPNATVLWAKLPGQAWRPLDPG